MFLEQKGLEMSFKESEGGTVMEKLRKGVPEFGGHGAERPATQVESQKNIKGPISPQSHLIYG